MSFRQEKDVVRRFDRVGDIPFWRVEWRKWKIALQQRVVLKRERRCGGVVWRSDLRGQQLSIGEFLEITQMVDRGRPKGWGAAAVAVALSF
jgi:hypothetical protein